MFDETWSLKVATHLDKAVVAMDEEDTSDLVYRTKLAGENSLNLLRLVEEGTCERNFYMLKQCVAKYHASGVLSQDYSGPLEEAYQHYRDDAYVDDCADDELEFQEAEDLYKVIYKMVQEIHHYLVNEGKLTQ